MPYEAVARSQPLDRSWTSRYGIVTKPQQWSDDPALPGVLVHAENMAQVDLPDSSRRGPGLVVEVGGDGNYIGVGFQHFRQALHAVRLQHHIVVKQKQVITAGEIDCSHALADGVWRFDVYSFYGESSFACDDGGRLGIAAGVGDNDLIGLVRLCGKRVEQRAQGVCAADGWDNR